MSNYNEALTRRMIGTIIGAYADVLDAKAGTKDRSVKLARYQGLAEGIHYALTLQGTATGAAPASVELDVVDAFLSIGHRPPFATNNKPRKEWSMNVTEYLLGRWLPWPAPSTAPTRQQVATFLDNVGPSLGWDDPK